MKYITKLKRFTALLLMFVLLLTTSSCRGSEAKKVDKLILNIGDVTAESGEVIEEARTAYEELSDEEKKLVKEYEQLETIEDEYEECLLDALEGDSSLKQIEMIVSAAMASYSPSFRLDREERVLYFETTADQDSTETILYYPGLATAIFNTLENNMCKISSDLFEVTQKYHVDTVSIMHGYYEWSDLLKVKNGDVVESIL